MVKMRRFTAILSKHFVVLQLHGVADSLRCRLSVTLNKIYPIVFSLPLVMKLYLMLI